MKAIKMTLLRFLLFWGGLITGLASATGDIEEHPFIKACQENDIETVKHHLGQRLDPNTVFTGDLAAGKPVFALHVAVLQGHKEIAKTLLEAGVNPFQVSSSIILATKKNHAEIATLLLDTEHVELAQINWSIFLAAAEGCSEVLDVLTKVSGVDPNQTWNDMSPLYKAAENGHSKAVRILTTMEGIDPNLGLGEMSPLLIARENGHYEVVAILENTLGISHDSIGDAMLLHQRSCGKNAPPKHTDEPVQSIHSVNTGPSDAVLRYTNVTPQKGQ